MSRHMTWIQTYTGRQFFPFDPRREDVDIHDIAHSLSFLCRFNGHCRVYYSVAEHSLRVSRLLEGDLALWGLLHDAAEAYLSDLPRPIKASLPAYVEIEARLLREITGVFGLRWPMPAEVRQADDVLLATEARDLVSPPPAPWGLTERPLVDVIVPLPPEAAEREFLARFAALATRAP